MGRHSSYLTSFARTHAQKLPPATEDAWNWQLRGSCLGQPVELFFPDDHAGPNRRRQEEAAKRICRECPVLKECRDHALRTPEPHGIWGAMTAQERTRALLTRTSATTRPGRKPVALA
jgi:WhiB family transcriptional regulator, redox-sensing transcriptional regulator